MQYTNNYVCTLKETLNHLMVLSPHSGDHPRAQHICDESGRKPFRQIVMSLAKLAQWVI